MSKSNFKITSAIIHRDRGLCIEFRAEEIMMSPILFVQITPNAASYFFIVQKATVEGDHLLVSAKEVGYWAKKLGKYESFKPKDILGLPVSIIENQELIDKIIMMSNWM